MLCAEGDIAAGSPRGTAYIVGHNSAEMAARIGAHAVPVSAAEMVGAIARIAAQRVPDGTRPAPLYLRPADAAPPRDPAPVIL